MDFTLIAQKLKFRKALRLPRKMFWALIMEGVETKDMLRIFYRHGKGKLLLSRTGNPTPEELQQAKEQLRDIPRFLPFFVVVIVPAPGITEGYALLAFSLEKWLGHRIRLLPSQFRKVLEKKPTDQP